MSDRAAIPLMTKIQIIYRNLKLKLHDLRAHNEELDGS